jgi:hypothetical protein
VSLWSIGAPGPLAVTPVSDSRTPTSTLPPSVLVTRILVGGLSVVIRTGELVRWNMYCPASTKRERLNDWVPGSPICVPGPASNATVRVVLAAVPALDHTSTSRNRPCCSSWNHWARWTRSSSPVASTAARVSSSSAVIAWYSACSASASAWVTTVRPTRTPGQGVELRPLLAGHDGLDLDTVCDLVDLLGEVEAHGAEPAEGLTIGGDDLDDFRVLDVDRTDVGGGVGSLGHR